jgi:hypothetical protein
MSAPPFANPSYEEDRMKTKPLKIEVEPYWDKYIWQLRAWVDGYRAGRGLQPGVFEPELEVPGREVLRLLDIAFAEAKRRRNPTP